MEKNKIDTMNKKELTKAQVNWFKVVYKQFEANNEGCPDILEYIEKIYGVDKLFYKSIGRQAGFDIRKSKGKFTFGGRL